MQNNDQNERVHPRLASAADLKGGKDRPKKPRSIRKKWAATIICLVVLLGAVIGGYFVAGHFAPEAEEPKTGFVSESVRLIERERADLDRMVVLRDGEERYTLVSNLAAKDAAAEDEADAIPDFEIEGMPYFAVDSAVASKLAVYSYSFTASKLIGEDIEDLAPFGLAEPAVQLRLLYHDGSRTTINLGGKVAAGSYYYCTLDDSHDVYMAYVSLYNLATAAIETMHVIPELAAIDAENMRDITIAQRGRETVQMQFIEERDESISFSVMHMVQPIVYDVHDDRSVEIFTAAAAIAITDYAGHAGDEEGLAEFGLAEPYAEITMLDANETGAHYVIGDFVPGSDTFRYITVDDTGDVYTVDNALLGFLSNTNVSYLVDQFANLVFIRRVAGFEIVTADTTYSATIEHEPEITDTGAERDKQTYYYEGQLANEEIFRDFYQVVIGTLFDKRIEDPEEYHLEGAPVVTVVYHMIYTDEPFTVEYIEYDRDYYAIRRDDLTLFLIRKDKVQQMVDTAELYRRGEYFGSN